MRCAVRRDLRGRVRVLEARVVALEQRVGQQARRSVVRLEARALRGVELEGSARELAAGRRPRRRLEVSDPEVLDDGLLPVDQPSH